MTSITSAATSTCTIVSTTTNSDPPCRPPCWPPCLPPCWPQCRPPCLLPCRPPPPKPRPTPPWPILSPNLSNQNKKMKSGANALKTMGQICKNYGAKWSKLWGKCAKNYGANLQRASNTQSQIQDVVFLQLLFINYQCQHHCIAPLVRTPLLYIIEALATLLV